jgi:hypothetical protein
MKLRFFHEFFHYRKVLKCGFEYTCGRALHTAYASCGRICGFYADLYMRFNFMSFRFLLCILNM